VVAAVVILAFALTYAGGGHQDKPFWDRVYRTMVTFGLARSGLQNAQNWYLVAARWLLVVVALYALYRAWATIFEEQAQRLRLRRHAGHVVICGGGDPGFLLATAFRERGKDVVLIESDPGSIGLRFSQSRGIITLLGNALDAELLARAGIDRAAYLLTLCGDDATNAEIAARARVLLADRRPGRTVNCFVHIADLDLYHLIREREIRDARREPLRLQCFNIYESGARVMLREHPLRPGTQGTPPHAVIIGLGKFGESLAIHAARSWHASSGGAGNLRLTVVDLEATSRVESLCTRYPALRRTCTFAPYDLDVRSAAFQQGTFLAESRGRLGPESSVYFCLRDETASISAALALRQAVDQEHIVVRVRQDAGLVALLARGAKGNREGDIEFFGLLPRACDPDVVLNGTNEVLARAIHESYLEHRAAEEPAASNPSVVSWEELPASLKDVNREQADHIGVKLATVGCRIAPLVDWTQPLPSLTAEEVERLSIIEHERWVQQLLRDQWTYHASEKDAIRKLHPNLVPWEQLSDADKEKDRETVRNIPPLLARVGFRIARSGSTSA
jgi:Trk K+ transport system NAD-binding subunit